LPHNEFGQPIGDPVDWHGARSPGPVVLEGRRCRLEPLTMGHVPDLFAALVPGGERLWTYLSIGPCHSEAELAGVVADLLDTPGWVVFAVCEPGGRAVGFAAYLRVDPALGTIEIGSVVWSPRLARTAAATEAIALMAGHVFDDLGYRRLEWKCDALNEPSRRAALRLGFRFEGVWRQATLYKGRNRDTAWFAMTDADWPGVRTAYERWLRVENFDVDGCQRSPLAVPGVGRG
jgi:RimJ/RimL family protein N-acetyltransferase